MDENKPVWASKTLWANGVAGLSMLAAAGGVSIMDPTEQNQLIAGIMVILNIILRFVTKSGVKL